MDDTAPATTYAHPEEIRASVEYGLGPLQFAARIRTTPAGLVCAGVMVAAILLSTAAVVRSRRA